MHRLSDIDPEARTAICEECGPVRIRPKIVRSGKWRCRTPHDRERDAQDRAGRPRRGRHRYGIPKAELTVCARCGFVAEDPCQLDVHHVDGDHANDDRGNLEVLCANCHRLEHRPGARD